MSHRLKLLCCLLSATALATKQPTLPIGECSVNVSPSSDRTKTSWFSFPCQLAAFGAYVGEEKDSVKVELAPGDKMLGCSSLPVIKDDQVCSSLCQGAAVIVRRGGCSFQEKLTHVAARGATSMVLVNSEDALVSLSSLEYEHSAALAVSVTKSDGERLIQLVKGGHELEIKITATSLVDQARARLQFLGNINCPRALYDEFVNVVEHLDSFVGTLDHLLQKILSNDYGELQGEGKVQELVDFLSWSTQQLSKWEFTSEISLHASVAAAVFQIQLWLNKVQAPSRKTQQLIQKAAHKLIEAGYYSHSAALFHKLLTFVDVQADNSVRCQLSFTKYLQGDIIASLSQGTDCKTSELDIGIPSLQVALKAFDRLTKLKSSASDTTCLEIAAGKLNDTNVALRCCSLVEHSANSSAYTGSLSREFITAFTNELFHSSVMMGVFLDELGAFEESLCFFSYASQLCEGDRTTLKLRQILAVPVVFASQSEMDSFVAELKSKIHAFTKAATKKHAMKEQVISPLGSTDEMSGATQSEVSLVLRPESAAYLRYTITPPTMFIGYQGVNVLSIQRAINELRTLIYPSLSSTFEPQNASGDEAHTHGSSHKLRHVGFISAWFRVHSVGKLLLGIVQNLNRTKFRVSIYRCVHFLREFDEMTDTFKDAVDEFIDLPDDQDVAVQMLRQAQLDVVVFPELGMDEWTVLLSHHRVAPIQCVFWGHPITTGNPHIDYFILSEHFVSKDFDDLTERPGPQHKLPSFRRSSFSEQIVLFRGLSTIFTKPKALTAKSRGISRSRLHLPTNRRLYVCPQTLMKLHPAFDEALAGILELDDKAIIVLLASDTQLVWMEQLRRRFRHRFGQTYGRVLFLPTLPFAEFQALLALADVVLDPFPFGGGVTTLDALHLGIPVVTFPPAQSVVHLAAGFLRYMNASDCIANSLGEYIQLAVDIATNHEDIQQRLLSHGGLLSQDETAIEDWNIFLESVAQKKNLG